MNLDEAKRKLKDDFLSLRRTNIELIDDLTNYSERHNSQNIVFMQGHTFLQCINVLTQVRDLALTEDNLKGIIQSKSIENIEGVATNIEIQIRHHTEVRDLFNYYVSVN